MSAPVAIALGIGAIALAWYAGEHFAAEKARVAAEEARLVAWVEHERAVETERKRNEEIIDGHRDVVATLADRVRRGLVAKPPRASGNPTVSSPADPPAAPGVDVPAPGVADAGELAAARQLVEEYRALSAACGKVAIDLAALQKWAAQ